MGDLQQVGCDKVDWGYYNITINYNYGVEKCLSMFLKLWC